METVVRIHNESEYNEILQQAVAVIETGDNVVKRLSADLKSSYPKMGMSVRNLFNMKRFYVSFHEANPKVQQAVALLPWGHINYLMSKFGDNDDAIGYYACKYQEKGWSRDLLINAVKL